MWQAGNQSKHLTIARLSYAPSVITIEENRIDSMLVGYTRISTADQNLDFQMRALYDFG